MVDKTLDEAEYLDELSQALGNHYLVCAGTAGTDEGQSDALGLVPGHAYSVLRVAIAPGSYAGSIVQLRNPWGGTEWNGDWSDRSPLWRQYADVAEMLGHQIKNDGKFWCACVLLLDNCCMHLGA